MVEHMLGNGEDGLRARLDPTSQITSEEENGVVTIYEIFIDENEVQRLRRIDTFRVPRKLSYDSKENNSYEQLPENYAHD